MEKRDLISLTDLSHQQLKRVLVSAAALKTQPGPPRLEGKQIALLFQKPSLRTRVSFDVGIQQLGGHPIYLGPDEVGIGKREPMADVARVLSRYVDGIVARVFRHTDVVDLAQSATVPVINALSDGEHPCQALADLQTIQEHKGSLEGLTVAYIGDGNNVAVSLLFGAVMAGAHFRAASPPGYELPEDVWKEAARLAGSTDIRMEQMREPEQAVQGADVVYTDVWTSMGQEKEKEERIAAFEGYQVTPSLLAQARPGSLFMHPLPAHQGEEIAPGLLDHSSSVVFDQAENRLHAQKALLLDLLGGASSP